MAITNTSTDKIVGVVAAQKAFFSGGQTLNREFRLQAL